MPTVGAHALLPFAGPTTGPVGPEAVRGNDETLRQAYVTHDADETIHVQSSTLANRPAFGEAGRLWITTDGTPTPWLDTGAAWVSLAGGVSDGDKGDITVSASGATWTIDAETVTYAKMQNVSSADRLLGRGAGAGAGDVQEIVLGTNLTMSGTTLNAAASGSNTLYAPGSVTVATGNFAFHCRRLQLTSTQRLSVAGTGRFRLSN